MKSEYYTPQFQQSLRFLASRKSQCTGGAVDIDELFSIGECAVAKVLQKFDPSKGSFSAWAFSHAKWAMQDYMRKIDTVSRRQRAAGATGGMVHLSAMEDSTVDRRPTKSLSPTRRTRF
jgi:DNA-directed RNA polymerase specialized sigma subunit